MSLLLRIDDSDCKTSAQKSQNLLFEIGH